MPKKKLKLALIFGGRSAEHDISVLSAKNVFSALDKNRYEIMIIGINKDGRWVLCENEADPIPTNIPTTGPNVVLLPGMSGQAMIDEDPCNIREIDLIFPILHGPYGEDGTIQGMAKMAGVPCVGSDVLASALTMDKDTCKRVLRDAGLPIARFRTCGTKEIPSWNDVSGDLGRTVFIKPARLGSSVGISRAQSSTEYRSAVQLALSFDKKILIEEFVVGRELECGLLERRDGTIHASKVGEIITGRHHDFYSYEAKYLDQAGAKICVPCELPENLTMHIQDTARSAFLALNCSGLLRVDFFLREYGDLIINEVNSMPGFTDVSMFPLAFEAAGLSTTDILDILIQRTLEH